MIKWMESGTLFQTKPWLGELPTSSPSVSNMAGQSRNKMEVSCCETWEDGPESHGWLPEGIHAYPFWGVQESQATRLILDASLLCLSKVSGHRKKMMELQYNSFPQQIKIPPSNPSLGGAMREVGSVSLWSTSSIFCIPEIGPWPQRGYHGISCFYSNFSGKRFKHRVFRLDLVDVSVEVGGFWWSFGMILSWDSSHFTPKKRSKSKMSKIRVFATN